YKMKRNIRSDWINHKTFVNSVQMKTKPKKINGNIAVLDVGSTKVACFIAKLANDGSINVNGIGHQLSKGIRSGHIIDIIEAETSVVAAVHAAEQMAGDTIENVVVNIGGAGMVSHNITVELIVSGDTVGERDLVDIINEGRGSIETDDDEV